MINIATFSSGQEDILERVHLEISSNSLKSIPTVARQDFLVIIVLDLNYLYGMIFLENIQAI